jgi:glutamyl-tRNA reductase
MDKFGLIGISHRRASAEEIGHVSQAFAAVADLGKRLGLSEWIALRTCNRIELYWHTEEARAADSVLHEAAKILFPDRESSRQMFRATAHALNGESVVKHLYSVICGLDSVVVGDEQIVGQFRAALGDARQHKTCGPALGLLGDSALKMSRTVRKQVDFSRLPSSVAEVAAIEMRRKFQGQDRTRVVLIGAGEMIRATASRLKGWKGAEVLFVNRTLAAAKALAEQHGGTAISLQEFLAQPADFDAMVAAVAARTPVLQVENLQHLPKVENPRLLLDLGIPQNLSPAFAQQPDFRYLDVIELGRRVEASRREIELLHRQVRPLLRHGLSTFREKLFQKALAPVAHQLRASVEQRAEFEVQRWLAGHLAHLNREDQDLVERLARRVASQSVQIPLTALRRTLRDLPMGQDLLQQMH